MYDWGDIRFFLAVARAGSTLAAARELGVNQTTVARRIASLEAALKTRLFDRKQDGYRLSEAGQAVLAQAERVATESDTLERLLAQRGREAAGVVRLTTAEAIANMILAPWLGEFMDLHPDIKIEVISSDRRLDLARGEADIALRAGPLPSEAGFVVRKLADAPWALYCSKGYAARRGKPKSAQDLNEHIVIAAEGPMAKLDPYVWLAQAAPKAKVRSVCTTNINSAAAIKAGHGLGPLPCLMAVDEPELVECFPLPYFKYGYYLMVSESLKDLPRIRAFINFLVARVRPARHRLEGRKA